MTRDLQGSTPDAGRDPVDTPLLTLLRRYEADGFASQFDSRDSGLVHCFSCGEDHPAEGCRHGELQRLEGASDPADMLAVVPVRCPGCGAKGVLVANYGPEASAADAEVLRSLERDPTGGEAGA
jgi:DNA-directed RNA polymerase subunit N (RpoN/RPB10)